MAIQVFKYAAGATITCEEPPIFGWPRPEEIPPEQCESCGNLFPDSALEDVQVKVIGTLYLCAKCKERYQANGEIEADSTCEECGGAFPPDGSIAFENEETGEFFLCLVCARKKGL